MSLLLLFNFKPSAPFVAAIYRLLAPHYLRGGFFDTSTHITEGVQVPVGWVPTLEVEPLNTQAATAYWKAGPRIETNTVYSYQLRFSIPLAPLTFWKYVPGTRGLYILTGLGASLGPRN